MPLTVAPFDGLVTNTFSVPVGGGGVPLATVTPTPAVARTPAASVTVTPSVWAPLATPALFHA